jgi:hypothetical protein
MAVNIEVPFDERETLKRQCCGIVSRTTKNGFATGRGRGSRAIVVRAGTSALQRSWTHQRASWSRTAAYPLRFASRTDRIHQDVDLIPSASTARRCDVGTASTPESYLASVKPRDRRWVGRKSKSTDTLKLLIDDFPSAFLDLFDGYGSHLRLRFAFALRYCS